MQKASGILKDEHVTLSLDGWSNVHNQPIVCVAATTSQGETYLVDSVDTKDNSHTAEYLQTLAESAVENSESTFKFKVVGFVTDNTGNVTKLRRNLQNSPVCSDIPQSVKDIIIGLLSCSPSTASLERLFSSYGWIHSEIRNRLGNEKAAKLLFIFKVLNNA